jgi:hypothetical protein
MRCDRQHSRLRRLADMATALYRAARWQKHKRCIQATARRRLHRSVQLHPTLKAIYRTQHNSIRTVAGPLRRTKSKREMTAHVETPVPREWRCCLADLIGSPERLLLITQLPRSPQAFFEDSWRPAHNKHKQAVQRSCELYAKEPKPTGQEE